MNTAHLRHPRWRPILRGALAGLAALLAALVPPAHAEDNCRLQISNAKVDYGATTRAELLERQVSPLTMALGKQTVMLSATCKTPTLMTLFYRGNAADAASYQLGGGGSFTLRVSDARLDGRSVGLGSVLGHGQLPLVFANSVPLAPDNGAVPVSNDIPVKGITLQVQVEIDASLSVVASRVGDRTTFRGSGNFELMEN